MRTQTIAFMTLLLVVGGCTPAVPIPQAVSPVSLTTTEPTQSPFTPTPDSNLFTISVEIFQIHSQEEISKILYTKWLDHFVSENVSSEMRLDSYNINSIKIPLDQRCAKVLGGAFIVDAEVTAKTMLPLHSTNSDNTSRWMTSGGNIISESDSYITRLFNAAVFKMENTYTLVVITQIPMCD